MALKLEQVRALAERVAASHGLDVVDVEYLGGGGKHRTLRVFIEKNAVERAKLQERVAALQAKRGGAHGGSSTAAARGSGPEIPATPEINEKDEPGGQAAADEQEPDADARDEYAGQEEEAFLEGLPCVASLEFLSGVTHGDCEIFSRDFGTVLDVEELLPGTEYVLEVSSPGLDRRLAQAGDYKRFTGSLVKLQTFEAIGGNRHWQGRIAGLDGETLLLELGGKQAGKKPKKGAPPVPERIEIALGNVEKAHLVPEF